MTAKLKPLTCFTVQNLAWQYRVVITKENMVKNLSCNITNRRAGIDKETRQIGDINSGYWELAKHGMYGVAVL